MRRAAILAALVLAGCSNPTFTLQFRVTDGPADACKPGSGSGSAGEAVTECQYVPMSCAAVVNIRVFNPNTPTSPIINVCQELMMADPPTLCEVAQVNLPQPAMPVDAQTLEVEILVYPKNQLAVDSTNTPVCPAMPQFGVDGFPKASLVPCMPDEPCDPTPSIGGSAFYHPGDAETVVELGCVDLGMLNEDSCTGAGTQISATVTDFDTLVSVPESLAQQLQVAAGEPVGMGTPAHYALTDPRELALDTTMPLNPVWHGQLDSMTTIRCVQVDEPNVASRTDSVRCAPAPITGPPPKQLVGTRLAKSSLDLILAALGLVDVPDTGLVIGIVLDDHGNPAAGLQVAPTDGNGHLTSGTIRYLLTDHPPYTVGGTATSTGGIFVSTDAAFGTTFTATKADVTATAFGGLIDGKVTIVILQLPSQTGA